MTFEEALAWLAEQVRLHGPQDAGQALRLQEARAAIRAVAERANDLGMALEIATPFVEEFPTGGLEDRRDKQEAALRFIEAVTSEEVER